jgi:light-regulated signal transduction histidine kinase (bacteriophytochrome)
MDKNEQLEVSNAELQQFAWVASHDLKEPLRKIQTYNYLIKDKLEAEHDIQPYLERTIRSSQRMSQLIDNLLNFSRLSANGSFQPVDLNTVLSEIVSDLEISIAEKNATINAGPLPTIEAEPSQMRQVFQNLISNSLKFTKPGVAPEITIHAEYVDDKDAELPAVPQGDFCRITITDNGIGFNERYLDRIFNIFQRLHDRKTYDGTGVGLAITKKIIDKHNGIITARSRENEGASFIVVLPVKQNHQRNSIP